MLQCLIHAIHTSASAWSFHPPSHDSQSALRLVSGTDQTRTRTAYAIITYPLYRPPNKPPQSSDSIASALELSIPTVLPAMANPPGIDTASLERSDKTGLTDSTHTSSSSASEKYRLDEQDEAPILLYKYRGGLQTSSQKDLCAWLDKDENFEKHRVTRKPIPRYTSYVDVKRHDLYMPEEKASYEKFPNYDSSLASIKIPSIPYWSRMFLGRYPELYIVSPESSPNSSIASGSTRDISPTSTFAHDSPTNTHAGASREGEETGLSYS